MTRDNTYRHLFAAGTRRGCPCCLRMTPANKRAERRVERRFANADVRQMTVEAMEDDR